MTKIQSNLELLATGSPDLDRILGGGLPARSINLVAGQPGTGKTLLALQIIFHLARQGRKCLYLTTLSEPALKLVGYMRQFSFFENGLVGQKVVFADIGSVVRGKSEDAILTEITALVEREEPAVVVIDSFKAVREMVAEPAVRTFVYDLAVQIAGWGAASLLVGEYSEAEIATHSEFAIADGIIRLINRHHELIAVREIEVVKLRGADYVTGHHFFEIGTAGLTFFPRVRSPDAADRGEIAPSERVPTGVAGLDAMLGGGLPRASATVVQGGTGTGKTVLALHFLLEGARRGEPGIHFTLEETPDQLRGIAHGFGWDLRALEKRKLLTLAYVSPVELSTDTFLNRAREQVERLGARRVVLDSLTSMAIGVLSERRFKELVYAMTKHFRVLGVTLQMNMEIAELLGSAQISGYGVSFAADNVIQLKYVEVSGGLDRGILVLKARGVRHATEVRAMSLGADGIKVGSRFH
ncbi:MAG: ATPase domain-containing protein, partial [Myxococcales bacterium]